MTAAERHHPETPPRPAEPVADRDARLAHERALLREGFNDIQSGRYLSGPELDRWLDQLVEALPPSADAPRTG